MKRRRQFLLVSLSSLTLMAAVLAVTPDAKERPVAPAAITFKGREILNTLAPAERVVATRLKQNPLITVDSSASLGDDVRIRSRGGGSEDPGALAFRTP